MKAADDDLLFGPVVKLYLAESKAVWNDPAVWIAERDRHVDPAPIGWPMPVEGTAYERELATWFNGEVEIVLLVLAMRNHPASPDFPLDVGDPRFQLVLRVVARAWEAGWRAVEREFAGQRITGWGKYQSEWRAEVLDWMLKQKLPRKVVYDAFGISKPAAQRSLKKSRSVRDRPNRTA